MENYDKMNGISTEMLEEVVRLRKENEALKTRPLALVRRNLTDEDRARGRETVQRNADLRASQLIKLLEVPSTKEELAKHLDTSVAAIGQRFLKLKERGFQIHSKQVPGTQKWIWWVK